ncbi:Rossmann-fold NAD(P)-binding domain-containing protein [Sphingobacterium pedocola]|uniref:Epimerase n=1 Tax=Sphingobacterium pedocola TaxID=2082722 RepID=A0ABR9T626_9SPHI|nr:epimerase [Sphingobacterium pedocola]MBE8720773.1 epimerase [Sphingobacterium pedocola]
MKIILTGTTGMVGEGVLLECLTNPYVTEVLSVSRKSCNYVHSKLKEYIVPEFLDLRTEHERLNGYDACFFCAGISSVGLKGEEYTRITFDTTIRFEEVVLAQNPNAVFIYVSGAGTDSTENGRSMWARVKGKTENTLAMMPFKKVYNFRPGFMKATGGQKHLLPLYQYIGWMYPLLIVLVPNGTSTLQQVAKAMIRLVHADFQKKIINVKDIKALA